LTDQWSEIRHFSVWFLTESFRQFISWWLPYRITVIVQKNYDSSPVVTFWKPIERTVCNIERTPCDQQTPDNSKVSRAFKKVPIFSRITGISNQSSKSLIHS
jgi:hypothetical protein